MLDSEELRQIILREVSIATSYGMLLDLYYTILKEHGISYVQIRAKRMKLVQLNLFDKPMNFKKMLYKTGK